MLSIVSISSDWTLVVPVTTHDYLGPLPPAPAPGPLKYVVHVDVPVPMFWPPGMALGQNKLAATVLHKGLPIIQDGHDCGAAIVHIPCMLPPPSQMANALLAVHIPFSSRKTNFAASTVVSGGKATATAMLFHAPPTPMTSCFDPVSPPTTHVFSHGNTVMITITLADLIIGWVTIGATMIFETACAVGSHSKPGPSSVAEALEGKLLPDRNALIKAGIGCASGVARMIFTDGPVDAKFSVGSPFGQVEVGVSRGADGNYDGLAGVRHGTRSGEVRAGESGVSATGTQDTPMGSGSATWSSQDGGSTSTQGHSLNPWNWGGPL